MTTNEKQLKKIQQQIGSVNAEIDKLGAQFDKIQTDLSELEAPRDKALRDFVAGETKAAQRLDVLATEEINLRRQLGGTGLLMGEKQGALSKLQSEAAVIHEKVSLEHFRAEVTDARNEMDKAAIDLKRLLETTAIAFCTFHNCAQRTFGLANDRTESFAIDARNSTVAHAENLRPYLLQKIANENWHRPAPGPLGIVAELPIPACYPPKA